MAVRCDYLAPPAPGVRAARWWTDELFFAVKETYAVGRVELGQTSFWSGGETWESAPGSLVLEGPGNVHRDIARDGPGKMLIVSFTPALVENAVGKVQVAPHLEPGDPRGAAFQRLCAAVTADVDRLALDVAIAEAIAALGRLGHPGPSRSRPVRRAVDLLHARFGQSVTLDDLAAYAGLDKYHLCRAFRAQVGMPPHAYLTRLRVRHAKELLSRGKPPRDVAQEVGFYDQSLLNRHFRRIVGTTPGAFARRA